VNDSENFLARWSRLKRETTLEKDAHSKQPSVEDAPPVCAPSSPPFDPTNLPSLESIDAATDIRPFLETNVPEELTRAALRNTWSADPAIRDFVGIADNQWDFNAPTSIPGFGLITAADYLELLPTPPACEPARGTHQLEAEEIRPLPGTAAPRATSIPVPDSSSEAGTLEDSGSPVMRSHGGALPQ